MNNHHIYSSEEINSWLPLFSSTFSFYFEISNSSSSCFCGYSSNSGSFFSLSRFYSSSFLIISSRFSCCYFCCLNTSCIFACIIYCWICFIPILTSSGCILLLFSWLSYASNRFRISLFSGNCSFIWASIWSWMIFCCYGFGFMWAGGPFFIICCCIFIMACCWTCISFKLGFSFKT